MTKPYIVGITGGSGSGKTTFLNQLANAFTEEELCIISQDDYYKPREQQFVDSKGVRNFDLPTAIDDDAFEADLKRLLRGESIQRKEYVFNNQLATPKILTFHPRPILIVEGIFIFHYEKIAALLDFKIFIEARDDQKVVRRILRDRVERNYPLEDVTYRYVHHVTPAYEQFIKPYQASADIIINNYDRFDKALEMVQVFLRHKLS